MVSVYEAAGMVGDGPQCGACPVLLTAGEVGNGRRVCRDCEDTALRLLNTVGALWEQLPDRLEKGTPVAGGGRGGGGTGSAAPGNIAALNLLAGDVVGRLIVWEDDWRRGLGWDPAPVRGRQDVQLAGILRFLRDHLPWAVVAEPDGVDGLLTDCRRLVGEMRAVVDPGPSTRVRTELLCPEPVAAHTDDDSQDGQDGGGVVVVACAGRLVFDRPRLEIRCEACHTIVPRRRWLELGLTLGTITLPEAA